MPNGSASSSYLYFLLEENVAYFLVGPSSQKDGHSLSIAFLISFRVSCEDAVISKFFSGYDKALRPGFGK